MKRSISIPTDTLWQAGFLLLTPFTAAWLMQFTYGVLPWAMLFPALLANALCIALLYWPLCGLTGRIAPCCIGIHIASGAWGAANCFVQSFRGTPILPWDLSALGTAAADGRERGILAGANVVMPNLSPLSVRKKYMLYDNKISTGVEAAANIKELKRRIASIGYEVVTDRGDHKKNKRSSCP